MVNETIQYYTENGGSPVYLLLLDATKAFDKVSFKYCLMYCWTKMYVLELLIYCTICILTSYAMLNGGMRNQLVLTFQMA